MASVIRSTAYQSIFALHFSSCPLCVCAGVAGVNVNCWLYVPGLNTVFVSVFVAACLFAIQKYLYKLISAIWLKVCPRVCVYEFVLCLCLYRNGHQCHLVLLCMLARCDYAISAKHTNTHTHRLNIILAIDCNRGHNELTYIICHTVNANAHHINGAKCERFWALRFCENQPTTTNNNNRQQMATI